MRAMFPKRGAEPVRRPNEELWEDFEFPLHGLPVLVVCFFGKSLCPLFIIWCLTELH